MVLTEIARYASLANEEMENIGARRLHTIFEKVLEKISFDAPEKNSEKIKINKTYVQDQLKEIIKDQDLSRYIL